jgi:hypothetical protein
MELQGLLAFLYYHTTLFYVIWIWSTLNFSDYLNNVLEFGAPLYFPSALVPELKKNIFWLRSTNFTGFIYFYTKNMNHLPFVCPLNIWVTTEPIIVATLGVKKPLEAPYLFGALRDLTFGDRRFWDNATKIIFINLILKYY